MEISSEMITGVVGITIPLGFAGFAWYVNKSIETALHNKIEELKEYMDSKFISRNEFEAWEKGLQYRLGELENSVRSQHGWQDKT